jgi:hypothetical protein
VKTLSERALENEKKRRKTQQTNMLQQFENSSQNSNFAVLN